jgi:hypothetical protein
MVLTRAILLYSGARTCAREQLWSLTLIGWGCLRQDDGRNARFKVSTAVYRQVTPHRLVYINISKQRRAFSDGSSGPGRVRWYWKSECLNMRMATLQSFGRSAAVNQQKWRKILWIGEYVNSRLRKCEECVENDGIRSFMVKLRLAVYTVRGHAVARWLRHCATNRKVAGSIPDGVIGIFHWHNPSGRTMTLGSTQPLTEMSTRSISWG